MIKYVSNLASNSSSPKIDISCKLIKISNTSYSSNTTTLNAGNVLFYHIKFNGLTSNDKIYQTYLTLVLLCPTYNFSMKLYYVDSLTTFPSSASSLYSAYESSKDTIYDQIAVPTAAAYNDNNIQVPVRFDLTEIIQNTDETNPEFIIAISTDNPSNHSINIIDIADYSSQIEFISATCVDLRGANNINKFDTLSLSNHYEGYLNLSNGNLVNIFKSFKTTGKKMPIEINVSYVFNRQTNTPLLYDKFSFNFEYSIYLENNLYIIEDYTGNRRAYQKIDRTISSFALKNMGIGHTELEGDIYYCYEDCSYFYFTIGSDGQNVIQLYDQNDNYYLFYNLNSVTQLRKIKNANSDEINFNWTHIRNNPNYLIGISNSDNDQVTFTYDSTYRVSQVNFVNEMLRANFTTSDSNFWMKIYNSAQCIRMFKADLNNLNISVIEEKTYANNYVNKMTFSYDTSSRLTQVNYYKGSSTLLSYQKYSYGSSYTKASDQMNNYYYYYFDRLGRVRTIIDDKGKTKTFNYDEIGNSAIKGVISQQEGISQTRNYIDNSRFEFLDDNNELLYWDKEGSPLYSLSSDGVHQDKYLYINNNSESFSLKQTSKTLPAGDYILKIKANPIISSGLTVRVTLKYEKFVKLGSLTGGLSEITIMPFQENYDITGIDSINTWKTYSTNKISVKSAMIDPYVIISIIVPKNERIYLDDFVFSKINQVSRYNLVNNGFFQKEDDNNLPKGFSFLCLDDNDKISSISTTEAYKDIIGTSALHLNQQEVTRINGYFRHRQFSQQRVLEGKVNDKLTLNIWCKCYATHNVNLKAFIKITYDHIGEKKYYFDFEKHQSNWQLLSAYVNAEDDYSLISVGVVYNGTKEAYFNCLQLFKGIDCQQYQYDNLARLVNLQSDLDHNTHVTYSSNKPQIVHTQDGNYYQYEYNEDGLLTKIIPSLGAVTEYIYDDSSRLIKTKTTSNNITFENEYQYDDNGNIVSQKDEFQNESTFTYDHLRRINSTTYPNLLKENKSYNIVSSLLALSYATSSNPNTIIHQNNISYDSNYVELTSYSSLNGGTYTFNYDKYGRLINIRFGANTLIAYTYNDNVNGVPSPLVKEKQYGLEGTKYTFIYDDNDLISKIKLGELSLFAFTYNQDSLPVQIYDLGNNQTTYFEYDDEGRLTKTICGTTSIYYQYDVMNNIAKKVYEKGTKVIDEYYDYDYETSLFSKNGFINRLSQKYFDELVLAKFHPHGMFGFSALNYLYEVVDDRDVEDKSYYFDNINQYLHYDLSSANKNRKNLTHLYTPFITLFKRQKTFYMWFRPNIITGKEITLFKLKNSSLEKNNIVCSICLNGNGKVVCKDKNKTILITSTNCVYDDDYNFLCFKIKTKNNNNYISINLNHVQSNDTLINESPFNIDELLFFKQTLEDFQTETSSGGLEISDYAAPIEIALYLFGISSHEYTSDELLEMDQAWQKYFLGQAYNNLNNFSKTSINHNIDEGEDFISLNGDATSYRGKTPLNPSMNYQHFDVQKDAYFKYDSLINRHIYYIDESSSFYPLHYNLPLSSSGTLSLFFKLNYTCTHLRYLFSFYDENDNLYFAVYINQNNQCYYHKDNQDILIKDNISLSTWKNIYLTYSLGSGQIIIDGQTVNIANLDLSNLSFYLGSNIDKTLSLKGEIESLFFAEDYKEYDLDRINKDRPVTIASTIDNFKRTTQKIINVNYQRFITSYTYDLSHVASENILGDDLINYTYTESNQLFSRTINNVADQFSYDILGRLTSYNHNNNQHLETYSYDNNGNVLSINITGDEVSTYSFAYDNYRLVSVSKNGLVINAITYDDDNILFPSSMTIKGQNKSLIWQGHRLVGIGDDIIYRYNYDGVRTYKHTNLEETTYCLEQEKIISLTKTVNNVSYSFAFTYDMNNLLSSIIYKDKYYFYIRDIFGNILGIINDNKQFIVKYTYRPYGQFIRTIVTTDNDELVVANHNPFLYKGYYYDEETNWYYVTSRYYNPEIIRWISPDSLDYLDPESINGLNLYAYCGNDPINKYDPTGHFGIWALVAITAASMLIGGTAQLVSNAMAGKTGSELWRGVAGATIGAGVNALALCLAMPTGGASLLIASGASAIAQTGVDMLETVIRGEKVDVGQTFIDLGLNFATTLAGNYLGGKMISTNPGWFQPQKFWSVFTKPYGQKILLQTAIGAGLSGTVNIIRKNDWSKNKPIIPVPVLPIYRLF